LTGGVVLALSATTLITQFGCPNSIDLINGNFYLANASAPPFETGNPVPSEPGFSIHLTADCSLENDVG